MDDKKKNNKLLYGALILASIILVIVAIAIGISMNTKNKENELSYTELLVN